MLEISLIRTENGCQRRLWPILLTTEVYSSRWRRFDPDQLLVIDGIARCYGRLPHEILDLTPYQLGIAWLCYQTTKSHMASQAERQKGPVFPVIVMGSL